jgi:hypothetical protein
MIQTFTGYRYNRVAGLEYNFASTDNRWQGKTFYHQSFYPGAGKDAASASGNISLFLTVPESQPLISRG